MKAQSTTYGRQITIRASLKTLYPWLIWFLSSGFIFYKYLLQVSPSVMVNDLMKTFSLSGAAMGNLAAFYFYAYLSMQLLVGILLDHFSPRRLMVGAILVCAFGAWLFASTSHLATAELGRLLIGIGGAFSAVGTMKLISVWFPAKKFALVSGLMMTMAMLGAIGGQAPLAFSVSHLGWRHTMVLCAIAGVILAIAIRFLISDGTAAPTTTTPLTIKSLAADLLQIVRNKQSWLISLYSGLAFAPISAFAGLWGIPYLTRKYGISREATASLVSLVFIGFAAGSPLAGWLSDRIFRRKPIMILGTGMSLVALSSIIYLPMSHFMLAGTLLLFGFFSGFFFVSFAYMREINDGRLSGTSISFINMFNAMCGAFSEPLIGKLLDSGWGQQMHNGIRYFSIHDYHNALLVLPMTLLIALLLQGFIKESFCRQYNSAQ
ncbi:MAG: MFS transporter [Gammaproteobacteria bacterium]|nr:MFS transporter [Gammaproteobacteria bacterium]